MMSAPPVHGCVHDDVAHQHPDSAKPSRQLRGAAPADGARRLDRVVVCHPQILLGFSVRHPAKQTAAAVVHQPGSPAAAVNLFRPTRSPPMFPPGASSLAEAPRRGASAFSSEIRRGVRVREAVAAVGSASVATADRVRKNSRTFRVAAASVIAEQQPSISKSGV